jgi:hypothetical protein
MNAPPRIVLVHAVPVAMAPIERAFQHGWPEAERAHLLDDTLATDLESAGGLNAALTERIRRLAAHAVAIGARGVLFTCSSFGDAIEAAADAARAGAEAQRGDVPPLPGRRFTHRHDRDLRTGDRPDGARVPGAGRAGEASGDDRIHLRARGHGRGPRGE